MISIVFVCTGNICRSPMAHYYMQKRVKDLGKESKYYISSCGTEAYSGNKATNDAIYAISKYGVNMINHRACRVEDANINDADYIICMTNMHYKYIINKYPKLEEKVYVFKKFVSEDINYLDIDDPWGLDLKVYDESAKEIVESVDKLILKLESGEEI